MRIVAGAAKGRRLVAPPGDAVRPTTDRVKEALFSSLQPLLPGARVLDLFAGSGALGLEALSRGAAHVTLVERDARACAAIRHNVAAVGLPGATLVHCPADRALQGRLDGAPFDIALLDPPYDLPAAALAEVLAGLVRVLAEDATVVVERGTRDGVPGWPPQLLAERQRRYGATTLHRARRVAADRAADRADEADRQEPT